MANPSIYALTDTWNNAGTIFTAIKMDVTDQASQASSLLMDLRVGGVSKFSVLKNGNVASTGAYSVGGSTYGASITLAGTLASTNLSQMWSDGAHIWAMRNGTNPYTFRVYGTYTDAANNELLEILTGSTIFIQSKAAGTGTQRDLVIGPSTGSAILGLMTNATRRWIVGGSTGHFLAQVDNTYDIGASGATRPRNIYVGSSIFVNASVNAASMGAGANAVSSTFLNIAAGTTAISQIRCAAGVAPSAPTNGDLWFDGTNWKTQVGGVTKTFTLA